MSARVFKPVVMSEMRRMLAGGSGGLACPEAGGQAPTAVAASFGRLNAPDGAAIARVRRDLFGPVDHEDSRRFVERELAAQEARDADRWGFDFVRGCPRKSGPGTGRYVWEKVTPQEKIPEPYALRHMQYLSRFAVDDAPTPATTAHEVVDSAPTQEASATTVTTSTTTTTTANNTKQPSVADYLKNRKRTCNAVKSSTLTPTEPKKARMTNS